MKCSLFALTGVLLLAALPWNGGAWADWEDDDGVWTIQTIADWFVVSTTGQGTHGDRLMFRLDPKGDCDQAEMITNIYSVQRNPNFGNLIGQTIGFNFVIHDPSGGEGNRNIPAGGDVVSAYPFLLGHQAMLTFGFLPVESWKTLMSGGGASLTMIEANGVVPETFFDITTNNWALDGFPEKITEASEMCQEAQAV